MSEEELRAREEFGALSGCFVEGDPEQTRRARRVKRRALALSISLQAIALAAVILLPLLGKAERIDLKLATPIPPYSPYHPSPTRLVPRTNDGQHSACHFCAPPRIPQGIVLRDPQPEPLGDPGPTELLPGIPGAGNPDGVQIVDSRRGPIPPPPPPVKRLVTHLEQAMLIRKVEPIYPRLAIQTRREGKVELRAIVATDGTIQSLQVVSGDVMFVQSALDAVGQWRYRPTYLNGQPVEVDTTVTVTYTLAH